MNTINRAVTTGLSLLLVILTGCSKSFLDKELIGVNPQTGSMENPENARAAVNACYAYVNGGDWNQGLFPRLLMESSTDNGWGANDYQDRPAELGVCDFTGVSPNNSYIDYFYKNMHEGIRNCNYVITNLAEVKTLSEQLKNRYIAEAKFLRAYFYFELVKDFGGDVMHNSFDPADATLFLAKSPPAEIYKQIYKDLEEAIPVLPAKDEYGPADIGRATKGAAMGYLAKAYLFNGDYANAAATAQTIISSNKYVLETTFSKIFEPENINGTESLFEVNYKNAVGFGNGPIPAEVTGAATVDGGWGWFGLTSDLENAYIAEGDNVRRKATINKAGEVVDNETPSRIFPSHLISGKPAHTSFRYYRKFYIPLNKRVGSPWQFNDIKMRFAEILLIHAEAAAFNNKEADALTSLNKVRARVGLADKTGLSGDALKLAIWNERRLELAGEGTFRWDDIRRITINGKKLIALLMGPNGTFVKYNTTLSTDPIEKAGHREAINKGYYFKEGVHELWPFPASAINANSALVQNPGYN
ncbi:RagB/SusD family nutrient uptake outer membrane protein [Pseudoflavitalea sp. X16]|uniref:RagB/SusD family nutrient uptake outer membrane protein n=1 Tax=Paraflavitalea devenefica TaxID=2716334 RepID=UPI00142282C4|nr:RagB/SusD family nutrient uptake outer membrane protein [Paraflavitalea devenefica]NII25480.1 RagB/SusD family nutrient uptake outer membrane protein [Paraflavitalea devenefica]